MFGVLCVVFDAWCVLWYPWCVYCVMVGSYVLYMHVACCMCVVYHMCGIISYAMIIALCVLCRAMICVVCCTVGWHGVLLGVCCMWCGRCVSPVVR